jgi:hypothetical protein
MINCSVETMLGMAPELYAEVWEELFSYSDKEHLWNEVYLRTGDPELADWCTGATPEHANDRANAEPDPPEWEW